MGEIRKPLTFKDAVRFHGHNGPFLAIGYRAGRYAMERLKPKGMKDISCSVTVSGRTPYTCIIDGIQCSSLCTIGKGNLAITNGSDMISITFEHDEKSITLIPRRSVVKDALDAGGFRDTREWREEEDVASLFNIEEGSA